MSSCGKYSDDMLQFLPEKLRKSLMQFQKEGVAFGIEKDGRCLIADEMGLGKTVQALSVAYFYRADWPLLVIVPSCVRYPWLEEIEKWFPNIDPQSINLIQSGSDIRHPGSRLVREALTNQKFQVIIVDESHYIKNHRASGTKFIVPVVKEARRKILLTGTPALARPAELFPQIQALQPDLFKDWFKFARRYCDARLQQFGSKGRRFITDGASNLEELQNLLTSTIMIRRLKSSVLTQLPPKQRQKISFDLRSSDLKKGLDNLWGELHSVLQKRDLSLPHVMNISPSSRENGADNSVTGGTGGGYFEVLKLMSELYRDTCKAKLGPVREYIKMLCEGSTVKMIIFGHHHIMLDAISETLHSLSVKFIRIDGSTPASERHHLVQQFQSDTGTRVAVLSMKAAGVGLTLTAAQVVVFSELDWTPGTLQQCEDRAHRIGQKSTVHIHYLVAKGTLDDWVWTALSRKTAVVSTTLNGKCQVLTMDPGNTGQVECLSNAEAYTPVSQSSQELNTFFKRSEAKESGQKSVLEFFSPSSCGSPASPVNKSCNKKRRSKKLLSPTVPTNLEIPVINLLASDESDEDFNPQFSTPKREIRKPLAKKRCAASTGVSARKRKRLTNSSSDSSQPQDELHDDLKQVREDQWSCPACTFLNHSALSSCEICSTVRHAGAGTCHDNPCSAGRPGDLSNRGDKSFHSSAMGYKQKDSSQRRDGQHGASSSGGQPQDSDDSSSDSTIIYSDRDVCDDDADSINNSCYDLDTHEYDCNYYEAPSSRTGQKNSLKRSSFFSLESGSSDDDYAEKDVSLKKQKVDSSSKNGSPTSSHYNLDASKDSPSISQDCDKSWVDEEVAAAESLFTCGESGGAEWTCGECGMLNSAEERDCEGCLTSRPSSETEEAAPSDSKQPAGLAERVVNLDKVSVFTTGFLYRCSRHTCRIYLYNQEGESLHENFVPLDVEMANWPALPDLLLHEKNLRHIQRFLRQWNCLSDMKRRMVIRSGQLFSNPVLAYDEIRSNSKSSKQRYTAKKDIFMRATQTADAVDGTLRVISRKTPKKPPHPDEDKILAEKANGESGNYLKSGQTVQVVDREGTPLCQHCQKPFPMHLLSKAVVDADPWKTRFCTDECRHEHLVRTNREYCRRAVFDVDRGVCQKCGINAHQFYLTIKQTHDLRERAALIQKSSFSKLTPTVKQRMSTSPNPGMFWHVDHIQAVADGGGECDVDNLRTLCTVCHHAITAAWWQKRIAAKHQQAAAACGDITKYFAKH